ncbi:Eco57I restriction-modification methylase domain-containing protein [Mammaliicoccus sp. I-M36]|uniref:Eco57I restriction-modification methylase domain-containing protein n=1 Tax=Mammaliicoccus sp. I-M36 TaxID=2898695 RepID=UPI001EFA7DB2|nr:Eco57I restriction-modification methylase domain-containing protein [Mammaliicoccus sp. I-M36]
MLNRLISDKSNISSVEISKFINYKIVKSFSEYEKYKSLLDLLKYEKPNKMNDFSEFEENIEKVIGKYNWSINKFDKNRLTPDIIGKVFEKYINQRENGAYYTDDDTINYIIDNTLIPNIVSRLSNNNRMSHIFNELKICDIINSPNKMIDEFKLAITKIDKSDMQEIILILNKTTIADISVGTGAFLVNSIDYLLELYKSIYENLNEDLPIKSIIKNITNNTIYGLDLMEDAINIARFRVYLKAVQIFKEFDIDTEVISKLNLHCVNSLLKNVKNLIPEVIENGGFDIIVGNPPYIEYSKIKNYTINGYKTLKAGNVYAYMIERSLELLKKEGNLGVIVPISIVSTQRMKTLRQLVMDECKDIWLANFADRPGSLFNGVHQKLSIEDYHQNGIKCFVPTLEKELYKSLNIKDQYRIDEGNSNEETSIIDEELNDD